VNGRASIVQGDALHLPFADGTVDLVVTSPPFFALRSYQAGPAEIGAEPTPAEFLAALWAATAEMKRVLKPQGSIWVTLGDMYHSSAGGDGNLAEWSAATTGNGSGADYRRQRTKATPGIPNKSLMGLPAAYALGCTGMLATLGGPDPGLNLILRRDQIWHKLNGLPESVTDRTRSAHEYWWHLVKSPRYYSALDELREPHLFPNQTRTSAKAAQAADEVRGTNGSQQTGLVTAAFNPLGKLPGSVWSIPSEPLRTPAYMLPTHPTDMNPGWLWDDPAAWKLLRAGLAPNQSSWPRDDTRGELRTAPAHYAAFPTEWPRRLILGWSPPGVCVECGQGRAPVVERARAHSRPVVDSTYGVANGRKANTGDRAALEATILGYACSCTPFTDHPGTGHVYDDQETAYHKHIAAGSYPARFGSDPANNLSARPKVGPWREYHLTGWTPPPTRPAIILDLFGGTGTTALVARALDRIGISLDLSADYCRLAGWRIRHHGGKATSRTNLERQGSLL
jgi:SAM-dependent methyltransferase